MCDEMERSLHDALCVVKRVLESKSVVPGGGAVEAALSIYLENYATSMVKKYTWESLLLYLCPDCLDGIRGNCYF
jgi:chaperonin GroEL (HSP60 family)